MIQEIKKIYIDSRMRLSRSISTTDFRAQLNDSVLVPDDTAVIVTDVCIPHSWYTIEYNNNNRIYFRVNNGAGVLRDYIAELPQQNFNIENLAQAVAAAMNNAVQLTNFFTGASDKEKGQINVRITNPGAKPHTFVIFSDFELTDENLLWNGPTYDPSNLRTCNGVIGNDKFDPFLNMWTSGFVDTLSIHSIYITSPQFNNNSLGPRGERNILKKLVTNSVFGDFITDHNFNEQDYSLCSNNLFQQTEFRITDVYGNPLDLHGKHVSFALIVVPFN